jgi:hypothetical protein
VWDLFYDADGVRQMLAGKIKEESLRTYLFTYSNVYDSISIVSRPAFARPNDQSDTVFDSSKNY